jgi:uncharacterized protein YjbI with pentapeptide repeats
MRDLPKLELREILEAHVKWLQSDQREGAQGKLSDVSIFRVSFRSGNLLLKAKDEDLPKHNLWPGEREKQDAEDVATRDARNRILGSGLVPPDMLGQNLRQLCLIGCKLWRVSFRWADLRMASLRRSYIWGCDFQDANLQFADLTSAFFHACDLRWSDLRGADLTDVRLRGSDLRGANLTNLKGFDRGQLESATIDDSTIPDWRG